MFSYVFTKLISLPNLPLQRGIPEVGWQSAMNLNFSCKKNFVNYELLSYIYSSLKISPLKYYFIKTKLSNLKEKKVYQQKKHFWRQ